MRLTKQTSHAIRILIDCAHAGGQLVKVAEIAERLDLTPQNAFKIVNVLARSGFLTAVRGRNGGVRLAQSPERICIGDVVRATEVTHVEVSEMQPTARSAGGINRILDNALEAFIGVLDQHTLSDLAGNRGAAARTLQSHTSRATSARSRTPQRRTATRPLASR